MFLIKKNETGKTPCRADFFIMTRKKSDGSFVSDEAKKRAVVSIINTLPLFCPISILLISLYCNLGVN